MRQRKPVLLTVLVLLAVCLAAPLFATSKKATPPSTAKLSHIRVVRLSFIQGTVTLRRPGSAEWQNVTVNTPIQEGFSLATTRHSFAEVQFENGSTVRLGEASSITFSQLALTPQGGHINHMTLDDGYATMNAAPEKHDEYVLRAAAVTLTPQGKAEFRADLNPDTLRVEVLDGHLQAADAAQNEKLGKNRVLTADVAAAGANFQVADKLQKDAWDKWTEARDRQSTLAYDNAAIGMDNSLFGFEDLVAYGDWAYFPGFGYGWAPYEPLGWSPYGLGAWSWYPGWGYTWISGEPWGWLPFHYGYWNFSPAFGWFWMPGTFADWSPALVDWYLGPGWIGWAPVGVGGVGGAAPCTLGVSGCLTAVPRGIFGTEPIRPGGPRLVNVTDSTGVQSISQPDPPAPSPAHPVAVASHAAFAPRGNPSTGFLRGPEGAPSSVVMGRAISADAFLKTAFRDTATPIHVTGSGMLGGKYSANAKATGGGSAAPQIGSSLTARSGGSAGSSRGGSPQILAAGSRGSSFGGGFAGRAAGAAAGGSFGGGGFRGAHAGAAAAGGTGGGGHAGGGNSGGHR